MGDDAGLPEARVVKMPRRSAPPPAPDGDEEGDTWMDHIAPFSGFLVIAYLILCCKFCGG
ncbi:MAG TPA: hypothetical protein VJ694_02570 [Patescibacteria group bacterium]|nr:hypothetical protein [Patescibacteria group bacterium]